MTEATERFMRRKWSAQFDPETATWNLEPEKVRATEPVPDVASDLLAEDFAQHIAWLHNRWLENEAI